MSSARAREFSGRKRKRPPHSFPSRTSKPTSNRIWRELFAHRRNRLIPRRQWRHLRASACRDFPGFSSPRRLISHRRFATRSGARRTSTTNTGPSSPSDVENVNTDETYVRCSMVTEKKSYRLRSNKLK